MERILLSLKRNFKVLSSYLQRRIKIRWAVALIIFWIILIEGFDWQQLTVGIILSFLITTYWGHFMLSDIQAFLITRKNFLKLIHYFYRFVLEMVVANIEVAKIVLSPKMPIEPTFICIKLRPEKKLSRVLYANTITLTPGTISVYLVEDELVVHALTSDAAHNVSGWYMEDLMCEIENKGIDNYEF
ncbi:MAG: Na+/H+ antiporter subunit E [Bacillota bacterium]